MIVSHGKCGRRFKDSAAHCGGCCETFLALSHFDAHRQGPMSKHLWTCNPLPATLGYVKLDGAWGPPESHANRAATGDRLRNLRSAS